MWLLVLLSTFAQGQALSHYNVDGNNITISGVSSGAYMAVQMGVAYGKTFSGVASVAGGLYDCAQGSTQRAENECTQHPENLRSSDQIAEARHLATAGLLDPLIAIARQKIYLFASPADNIILPENADKLGEFYQAFVDTKQIHFERSVKSAHGFPTLNAGGPCDIPMLPWLLNCNFDLAGDILHSLLGDLKPRGKAIPAHLRPFSQTEFTDEKTPLYPHGFIYVPAHCTSGALCRLHVALHGCQMNPEFIQNKFARLSGFNDWAESNDIIILYPQSLKLPVSNPYACWDWYGFTGPNYPNRNGPQMMALKKMVDRISSLPSF